MILTVKKIALLSKQDFLSRKNKKDDHKEQEKQAVNLNSDQILSDYVNFVARLTKKWNSLSWWSGSISSKNLWSSLLYNSIFDYIEIIETIKNSQQDEIEFHLENPALIKQLKAYCLHNKIILSDPSEKKGFFQNEILQPLKQFLRFLRKVFHDVLLLASDWKQEFAARKLFRQQIYERQIQTKSNYIIRSWIDERSFNEKGCYQDSYFGSLADFIQPRTNLIVIGGILSNYSQTFRKIRYNNQISHVFVIPTTFFNFPLDSLRATIMQYASYFRLNRLLLNTSSVKFKGLDVNFLVQQEILNDLFRDEYKLNLLSYYNAINLSHRIPCSHYIVPYENHNWEKLTFSAFKIYSPRTFTIGFQHGSIVPREINYFPSKIEGNFISFPNKVITVGDEPKRILEKYGNYPSGLIKSGCALRYSYLFNRKIIKTRSKVKKILIAFSINLADSVQLLRFICQSLKSLIDFDVYLKFHPIIPYTSIIKFLNFPIPSQFHVVANRTIGDLLEEIDLLIYSQTTVALEALMVGVPVIYVDLSKYYNCDPLFECKDLHWIVKKKDNLVNAIQEITNINDVEFTKQQRSAREYLENYFHSITDERLQEFLTK